MIFLSSFGFIPLVSIIGKKFTPGDHEFNFKKVSAIPCGWNTDLTYVLILMDTEMILVANE